jgi:hypothetical protein
VISIPALILISSIGKHQLFHLIGCSTDTFLAMGIIWAYQSCLPGLSGLYSSVPLAVGTAYYVSSLGANILLTILIISRLLIHRKAVTNVLPEGYAKQYLSVTAIIVESAVLYSVFALAFVISYALNNPVNQLFMILGSTCQVRGRSEMCACCNHIVLEANRRVYDHIKSCSGTRLAVQYADEGNSIRAFFQYTFQHIASCSPDDL